jgi:peroxiredoxin
MAETFTIKTPLFFKAANFRLLDVVSNKLVTFDSLKGEKGTLVVFICNHCPYVIHIINELVKIANEYQPKGIGFVAISSNDVENYPQDSPHLMKAFAEKYSFRFPYLYDETQDVARLYQAACTPDFNLFDAKNRCVYRGQMDDSRPTNKAKVDGKHLRAALEAVLVGIVPSETQFPSSGCNIKWKKTDGIFLKPLT